VPITGFVDTSRPPDPKDRITLDEIRRSEKAALGAG
jgi:hypothetical protein